METTTNTAEFTYRNVPLIVIAGRPNVGKSTLFNRLLHKRRVITDPTPGVTRDPVEETAYIQEKPVRIMDTGGFKLTRTVNTSEAFLDDLVVQKTLDALKKADLILLLLDASLITPEDEEFIALIRPYWDRVIAAVNKTEGGRFEQEAWNLQRFGFKHMLCISAEHGDRIPELLDLLVSHLDFSKIEKEEEKQYIKIAVMGKPNTGKSTLCNRLTGSDASIVSDYAGTTRDVVEGKFSFKGKNFVVLDTAGIRRKAKVKENVEYYSVNRAIKTLDKADVMLYLMDASEGLTEQDKKVIALAHERGRAIVFVLNKWDMQVQDKKTVREAENNIRIMFAHMAYAPIVEISAKEGTGIKDLLNTVLQLYKQLNRKIDTGPLNTALSQWVASYPPPASKSSHFSIRYAVQTSTNPVSFLLFVTKPESVPSAYEAYLKNKIRSDLGFSHIPVTMELKASRRKWEQRDRE
ncbi:MAG: ribosome biogenesis GTPase Der [Treponema lecithinolyticum]|uniref:ribosome biogenesis GTPase Der n=1 Tax=Treponema lecithinolyticum TaxID=53418 RepID=UPI003FA1B7D1